MVSSVSQGQEDAGTLEVESTHWWLQKYTSEKSGRGGNRHIKCQDESSKLLSLNDSLARALGKEKHGRVRAIGSGSCPTQIFGQIKLKVETEKSKRRDLESMVVVEQSKMRKLETLVVHLLNQGGDLPPLIPALVHAMVWRLQAALGEQAEIIKLSQQEFERLQNSYVTWTTTRIIEKLAADLNKESIQKKLSKHLVAMERNLEVQNPLQSLMLHLACCKENMPHP